MIFFNETTSVKCISVCIIHRKIIVIESKTNEIMDPEEHYPQNRKITLHYFVFNSDHTALF